MHDALKRRCLYHWVDHPDPDREVAIVRRRAPEVADEVARRVAALVAELRGMRLTKPPGVAETIDWAGALWALGGTVDATSVGLTLGAILKVREDEQVVREAGLEGLVAAAGER